MIKPWNLTIREGENERKIEGLYCIDEVKMKELSGNDLVELRDAGGLTVAYGQLLSMLNVNTLSKLEKIAVKNKSNVAHENSETDEISFGNLREDDTLNFDNF